MLTTFLHYLAAILQVAAPIFAGMAGVRGLIAYRGFDRVLHGVLLAYAAMALASDSLVTHPDGIMDIFARIVALSPLALWAVLPELSRLTRSPAR